MAEGAAVRGIVLILRKLGVPKNEIIRTMEYRGGEQQTALIGNHTDNWDDDDGNNGGNGNGNNDPQAAPAAVNANPAPLGGGRRRRRAKTRHSKGRKTTRHKKH